MFDRNPDQIMKSRNNSNAKIGQGSLNISNSRNYSFLQQEFNRQFVGGLMSPIDKVSSQQSHDHSQFDIIPFSRVNQHNGHSRNNSRAQSPAEFQNSNKPKYFGGKKFSIPEAILLKNMETKIEWNDINKVSKQSSQQYSMGLRKLTGKKQSFSKLQNDQQTHFSSRVSSKPEQYFSQKLIGSDDLSQKYQRLTRDYQELERDYERIKQENLRLKNSRDEMMNDNIKVKKQSSYQINNLSNEIQALKQQIYNIEMDRQGSMTNRTFNTGMQQNNNRGFSTQDSIFYSARGTNPHNNVSQNGEVNLFYLQQLQRQNEQLVRQNRRLNDIIMKKLRHSVADG